MDIDWDKPIELIGDLRPVKVIRKYSLVEPCGAELQIEGDRTLTRSYNRDGKHYANRMPSVRNVITMTDAELAAAYRKADALINDFGKKLMDRGFTIEDEDGDEVSWFTAVKRIYKTETVIKEL